MIQVIAQRLTVVWLFECELWGKLWISLSVGFSTFTRLSSVEGRLVAVFSIAATVNAPAPVRTVGGTRTHRGWDTARVEWAKENNADSRTNLQAAAR